MGRGQALHDPVVFWTRCQKHLSQATRLSEILLSALAVSAPKVNHRVGFSSDSYLFGDLTWRPALHNVAGYEFLSQPSKVPDEATCRAFRPPPV